MQVRTHQESKLHQYALSERARDQVGGIFGIEVSRLARNTIEWFQLLDLCRRHDAVLVEDSHIYCPSRDDDSLVLGIKGTVSVAELNLIRARMDGGRRNKALRGALYPRECPRATRIPALRSAEDPGQPRSSERGIRQVAAHTALQTPDTAQDDTCLAPCASTHAPPSAVIFTYAAPAGLTVFRSVSHSGSMIQS